MTEVKKLSIKHNGIQSNGGGTLAGLVCTISFLIDFI